MLKWPEFDNIRHLMIKLKLTPREFTAMQIMAIALTI